MGLSLDKTTEAVEELRKKGISPQSHGEEGWRSHQNDWPVFR